MDALNFAVHSTYMVKKEKKPSQPKHFIKKWRKHRGFTLEALAAVIGSTHATLSRIERGKLPYNEDILEKLAWRLKCTPADLLGRDPADLETA